MSHTTVSVRFRVLLRPSKSRSATNAGKNTILSVFGRGKSMNCLNVLDVSC